MPCPDDNLLQAFVERSLGEPERAELIAHLDGCPACRGVLAGYARTLALSSEGGEEATSRFGLGQLPREVGNFVATELLGAGAMGTVYLGRHRLLGHEVAIKVMRPDRALDAESEAVQRFIREARALTRIQDTTHIVRLYDFGQVALERDTLYYYAMEYAPGRDLERELRGRGRLEPALAWSMLRQICAGLAAAHESRILHRDLKPANVLVLDGEPLIARLQDGALDPQAAAALARTAAVPLDRRGRHAIAREINTRGFRLSLREENQQALPLFLAAATISDRYGIPRYNAARIYAQAGDLERCLLFLSELAALGPYQRPRLLRTQKDPAFEPVWDEARYQALFR